MLEMERQEALEWSMRARGVIERGLRMFKRDIGPASQAEEIRVACAFVEATFEYPNIDASTFEEWWTKVEGEWRRIEADITKRENELDSLVERYVPRTLKPELRELFRLSPNETQTVILGHIEPDGRYVPGLAGLTMFQYHALTLAIEPIVDEHVERRADLSPRKQRRWKYWSDEVTIIQLREREIWEIGRDMVTLRNRRQWGRRAWLPEATVLSYLRGARAKLRDLFWPADPEEPEPDACGLDFSV